MHAPWWTRKRTPASCLRRRSNAVHKGRLCTWSRTIAPWRWLSDSIGEILVAKELRLAVQRVLRYLRKRSDTVGQPQSAEICVSHMPSWKAKKLGKLTQETGLLER